VLRSETDALAVLVRKAGAMGRSSMERIRVVITASVLMLAVHTPVGAQHHGDLIIGSTADGGGALAVEYDFDTVVPVSFSESLGGVSIYTATEPGFDALASDEPAESFFVLDGGTQVSVEITGIDAGKTAMKLGGTTLAAVGDTVVLGTAGAAPPNDLHHHPELQLILMLPPGKFGEGSIAFRLTTTSASYASSEIHTLALSNGHLPSPAYDAAGYDAASVACQKAVGKQVRSFIGKKQGLLAKCLDKLQVVRAREVAALDVTTALAGAERACADASGPGPDAATMLGKIESARTRALAAIQGACPALDGNAVIAHLGLAGCRAEEIMAASYSGARADVARFTTRPSQGGGPLSDHFSCLVPSPAEEEEEE
jgi:hypothetical protein